MTTEAITLRLDTEMLNIIDTTLKTTNIAENRTDLIKKAIQLFLDYSIKKPSINNNTILLTIEFLDYQFNILNHYCEINDLPYDRVIHELVSLLPTEGKTIWEKIITGFVLNKSPEILEKLEKLKKDLKNQ